MSQCNRPGCWSTIRFVKLDTGRTIPVDPTPDERGNVAVRHPSGSTLTGYVVSQAKPLREGYRLHLPHHATCASAPPSAPRPRPPALFD